MKDKHEPDKIEPDETDSAPTQAPVTGWQFVAEDTKGNEEKVINPGLKSNAPSKPVNWSEAEFIANHKSIGWFLLLGLAAVIVATLVYIYNHDLVSVIVIGLAAVFLGIVANRQPRKLDYGINDSGLQIGQKFYSYDTFRSFAISNEESVPSIIFIPLRRFMPYITVYYSASNEKAILEVLNKHLPFDNQHRDAIDNLMRRIHY
ncbi:MAG: hypothetical protein ABSD13_20715 [Candidatus Korobacteraceae bacterium]